MKSLIQTFYSAFQQRDAETMMTCYHDDVVFSDPAFGELKGEDAKLMWKMLCTNAADLRVEVSDINASLKRGSAHWEAWYRFSRTGRDVHNIIEAEFEFRDSKIIKHTDRFNLHKWASQAMGWKGRLLGGTTFFRNRLQQQTHQMLGNFKQKSSS